MHARIPLLVAILLVLYSSPAPAQPVVVTGQFPLGVGLSPTTITPVTEGLPVFTVGDRLWVTEYSQANLNVALVTPDKVTVVQAGLTPNAPFLLHNFTGTDIPGLWLLNASQLSLGPPVFQSIQIQFVIPNVFLPTLLSYQLAANGLVSMNFTSSPSLAYDTDACLVGSALPDTVNVPLPSSLGTGQLQLARNGADLTIMPRGNLANPFTFWVELHSAYSYTLGGSTLVSRDVQVARTAGLPFSPRGTNITTVQLTGDLAILPGRYTLRAFFESSAGLSAFEAPLLIPDNSTWLSLKGCISSASLVGSDFSLSASLSQPISMWPRSVYLMYRVEGVDAFVSQSLAIKPAVIHFVAAPWGGALSVSPSGILNSSGLSRYAYSNGTMYIAAIDYPVKFQVKFPGVGTQSVLVQQSFSNNRLNVSSSKVVITTLSGGKPVSGATLTIQEGNNTIGSSPSTNGKATFYLPPGNYTIRGSLGNTTASYSLEAVAANEFDTTLELGGNANSLYSTFYLGTGIAGIVASVAVWITVYRRRESSPPFGAGPDRNRPPQNVGD